MPGVGQLGLNRSPSMDTLGAISLIYCMGSFFAFLWGIGEGHKPNRIVAGILFWPVILIISGIKGFIEILNEENSTKSP